MRAFTCTCGSMIFFENSQCVSCGSELGWCPACSALSAIAPDEQGNYRCMARDCNAALTKCHNYAGEFVCNRCVITSTEGFAANPLCDYCRFNDTIPDLNVPGNREKWQRLEQAKRRLLYSLDLLGLPYGTSDEGVTPGLSFDFKGDVLPEQKWWWSMGKEERVYTGHAEGKITINVREADHVEREKARVYFQEAHRTVIGHFRHEIGHYYWDMLIKGRCEEDFKAAFGDHEDPNYADALTLYYENGPPENWQTQFISAYACMHPWEDFAEIFATYLDMMSVLDTANNMELHNPLDLFSASLQEICHRYTRLGVLLNEMNRAMGLLDLAPDVLAPSLEGKLQFVHDLLRDAGHRQVN